MHLFLSLISKNAPYIFLIVCIVALFIILAEHHIHSQHAKGARAFPRLPEFLSNIVLRSMRWFTFSCFVTFVILSLLVVVSGIFSTY